MWCSRSYQIINKWTCIHLRLIISHKSLIELWITPNYELDTYTDRLIELRQLFIFFLFFNFSFKWLPCEYAVCGAPHTDTQRVPVFFYSFTLFFRFFVHIFIESWVRECVREKERRAIIQIANRPPIKT